MDVDAATVPPAAASAAAPGGASLPVPRAVKIHPLAIIGISDHHTRVSSGGSALPPSSPVVGLLFGLRSSESGGGTARDISIVDAEEMEYPWMGAEGGHNEGPQAVLKKIELHQTVFPNHRVVGWYRVHRQDENAMSMEDGMMPSEEDLRMNQTEMARYCGGGEGGSEGGDADGPLFVLMNASKTNGHRKPSSFGNASEEMEVDEELPLMVYETLDTPGEADVGMVFVNVDFELETYEPERIAVEKVFKTRPSTLAAQEAPKDSPSPVSGRADTRKAGKKSRKDELGQPAKPSYTRGLTEVDSQLDSLQSSIRAMNIRMNVLLEYLQRVEQGDVVDDSLLRSIDNLIRQLPLVVAALEEGRASGPDDAAEREPLREFENDYGSTMLLTYLAAVAKLARSVHVYSEKFRTACEGGRTDPRRPLF